ncbi:MAG: methyltransferase domain-containing protein [Deltaproteobacteria bacterium]|nr:methyltransferase domain-containing protein [Deltaproteobacteria bacterium]
MFQNKLRDRRYNIIKDPEYGYLRADPLPTPEEVDRFYKDEFYTKLKKFRESDLKTQTEQKEYFDWRWQDIHRVIQKGMEVAPEAVKYAREQGLDVRQGGVDDIPSVKRRYDIVLILDVLEHLINPAEAVLNIRKHILKPDGLLVIDVANDYNEFQLTANELYDLDEYWVVPPLHLNYFTSQSIQEMVAKCGYETFFCESSFPLEMFLLFGDVYIGDGQLGPKCHQKRVSFERALRNSGRGELLHKFYEALAGLSLGRQVVLHCRPKS